jgi:hypothetical protein
VTAKPTVAELGIDPAAQAWRGSGHGDGRVEVAFARAARGPDRAARGPEPDGGAEWILMRVTGDPEHRVLVFDRHEWECFLDGARNGEFDDATPATTAAPAAPAAPATTAAPAATAAPAPVTARDNPVS